MPKASPWTEERLATLRAEWATGAPTAEIGRRMGIKKGAVIGKAHRMRLPAREAPANIVSPKSRGMVPRPAVRANRELPVSGARAASPSRPRAATSSGVSSAVERRASSLPVENLPGAVAETPPRRVFSGTQCKFPLHGDERPVVPRFCAEPVRDNAKGCASPYCAAHYAECYATPAKNPTNPPPATWLKNRGAMWARG
jgi:GcrA cell cycle regulator